MRREARRREKSKSWWENKKIITSGSVVAGVLAFAIGVAIYSNTGDEVENRENRVNTDQIISLTPGEEINSNTESASSSIGNKVEESQTANTANENNSVSTNNEVSGNNTATNIVLQKRNLESNEKNNKEVAATTTSSNISENKEVAFDWPVRGEILKAFSGDSLLYSSTLKEWVAHNGIDIRADKTSVVTAAADGTVKSIKNDPRYGLTVVIEHENGFKTVYSNLLTAEFVVDGEKVTQGQSIGTVGNTANFEIADDSHLHFEILQNSKYIDPTIYLK